MLSPPYRWVLAGHHMIFPERTSWRRLGPKRVRYAITALGYLALSRVRFAVFPTRRLLGNLSREAVAAAGNTRALDPRLVAWSIAAVSRRLPWRSDCMIQAMAATSWLRAAGYAPEFHLGVRSGAIDDIEAHAWLTLDGRVVVGGGAVDVAGFRTILSTGRGQSADPRRA